MTPTAPAPGDPTGRTCPAARWELIRAVGAVTAIAPPASQPIIAALSLPAWDRADHTRLFVLDLPPYASIHLDPQGKIGGEAADRVAGLWRALALHPPADADHLASLCNLYAQLGHAAERCRTETARRRLDHARHVLFAEHMIPWLPSYLAAIGTYPPGWRWADLTLAALRRETHSQRPPASLPPALRDAPPPLGAQFSLDELLDTLTSPLRSGMILTHTDLEQAGRNLGVGTRRGERRYSLRAMLDHDAVPTLAWLAGHARRWTAIHHQARPLHPHCSHWWAQRAARTVTTLERQPHVRELQASGASGAVRP